MCDHSNESYWAVLSCGTVCYAVQGGYNFKLYGGRTVKRFVEGGSYFSLRVNI